MKIKLAIAGLSLLLLMLLAGCGKNQPPTVEILKPANDAQIALEEEIQFKANATDPEGKELTFSWDFGDGNLSDQASPTHVYQQSGDYTVTLTVTDPKKVQTTASITIHITGHHPTASASWKLNTDIYVDYYAYYSPCHINLANLGCWHPYPNYVDAPECVWHGAKVIVNGEYEYRPDKWDDWAKGWMSKAMSVKNYPWGTGALSNQSLLLEDFATSSGERFDCRKMKVLEICIYAERVDIYEDYIRKPRGPGRSCYRYEGGVWVLKDGR